MVHPIRTNFGKDSEIPEKYSRNIYIVILMSVLIVIVAGHCAGMIIIYKKVLELEKLETKKSCVNIKEKTEHTLNIDLHKTTVESFKTQENPFPTSSKTPVEDPTSKSDKTSNIFNYPKGPSRQISINNHSHAHSNRQKREVTKSHYRDEGTNNDELSVQIHGQAEGEADKSWLQLTSYARIPYNAIQEFCSKTRASCPPGPEGPIGHMGEVGFPGRKGTEGERGLPGIQGPIGPTGRPGLPGPPGIYGKKGDTGVSGHHGLDGRDGLPGEPGLDGIPGRNGLNGIPGIDGMSGFNGVPGTNGINGSDGLKGANGLKGDRGYSGPRGIAGPRGRKGEDGIPGAAGIPGINTWRVNGSEVSKLLIPPTIPGANRKRKSIVIREKENLRLRCEAAGEPEPQIEWSREDGMAIATGQWNDGSLVSPTLNLTHIRRDHTGTYRCEAYNGVPPNDYKTFHVQVHFNPFVRVNNWKVGSYSGSSTDLECHVEAFPIGVTYWENRNGKILENSEKHKIRYFQDASFVWKVTMSLQITSINQEDFGDYHCVAKNELSMTRGLIKLIEIDPNRYVPSTGTVNGLTFGPDPPKYSELFNDLCPAPTPCPECPKSTQRSGSRGSLYCLRVEQFGNDTYPGFQNRTLDCELSAVGKPVYHRHTESDYGSWMRDPMPRDAKLTTRYWTTLPQKPRHLFEYSDKMQYKNNLWTRNYTLSVPFQGTSHVIYNGSFIYHGRGRSAIFKYDLFSGKTESLPVPMLSVNRTSALYNEGRSVVDLSTDENGLWAIYGLPEINNTVVMKIDPSSLRVEYSWNISLSHQKFGEMFITCGVLYGVDSTTKIDTKIRFALDLYKKNILDVDLQFTNPFKKTTMLGYNPMTKELYSWDKGNQLTYPIKYIDIGYNTAANDKEMKKPVINSLDYDYKIT